MVGSTLEPRLQAIFPSSSGRHQCPGILAEHYLRNAETRGGNAARRKIVRGTRPIRDGLKVSILPHRALKPVHGVFRSIHPLDLTGETSPQRIHPRTQDYDKNRLLVKLLNQLVKMASKNVKATMVGHGKCIDENIGHNQREPFTEAYLLEYFFTLWSRYTDDARQRT